MPRTLPVGGRSRTVRERKTPGFSGLANRSEPVRTASEHVANASPHAPDGVWTHREGVSVWRADVASQPVTRAATTSDWLWWHRVSTAGLAAVIVGCVVGWKIAGWVSMVLPAALESWPTVCGTAGVAAVGVRVRPVRARVAGAARHARNRLGERAAVATVAARRAHAVFARNASRRVVRSCVAAPAAIVWAARWWTPVVVALSVARWPHPPLLAVIVAAPAAVTALVWDTDGRRGPVARDVASTAWGRLIVDELDVATAQQAVDAALHAANISLGYFGATLTGLHRDTGRVVYRGVLRGGATVAEFAARRENLASAFRVGSGRVVVRASDRDDARRFVIEVRSVDPLDAARDPHVGLRHGGRVERPWRFVPFGVDEAGRHVGWSPMDGGLLIGGQTGGGKSWLLSGLLAAFASHDPRLVRLVMVDAPKRGLDSRPWAHRFHAAGFDVDSGISVVEQVRDMMRSRIDAFDAPKWEAPTVDAPAVVLVVDEYGVFHDLAGRELDGMVAEIAATGRAVGVFLVVATQRAQADCVPTVVRDQLTQRVAFRCASAQHTTAILGGLRDTDPHPHDKRVCGRAGVGVMVGVSTVRRFGAFTAAETDVARAAAAAPSATVDVSDIECVVDGGGPVIGVIACVVGEHADGVTAQTLVDDSRVRQEIPSGRRTPDSRRVWVSGELRRLETAGVVVRRGRRWFRR